MIRLKEHKGITLIALVITIIVLLILAGVTINSIMGQDGTPEKAVEARKKNDQGAEFDAIKLAVVGAMGERMDVKVDAESLKNELNGLVEDEGRLAIRDDNAPWVVIGKTGKAYEITEKAVVTEVSGLVLSPRSLILIIQDNTYEEKTISANLIDIEGTISWSSSTDTIDITPSQDGKSAVIKAKKQGTQTITVRCMAGTTVLDEKTCSVIVTTGTGYFKQIGTTAYYYANPTVTEGIAITADNLGDYLGMKVDYTPNGNIKVEGSAVGTSNIYRLFYVDTAGKYGAAGTIYLKADQDMAEKYAYSLPSVEEGDDIVSTFNPMWSANSTCTANPQVNMTYVERLLDKNIWQAYKDDGEGKAGIANYVVGAPSLEMWVDSYNIFLEKYPVTGYDLINYTVTQDTINGPTGANTGYGYYVGHGGSYSENSGFYTNINTLVSTNCYERGSIAYDRVSVYFAGSGYAYYWLASPSASGVWSLIGAGGDNWNDSRIPYALNRTGAPSYQRVFCPIVCCNANVRIDRK